MSALAIALSPPGGMAPAALVRTMLASMAHRAPDGIRVWTDGSCAIGAGAFHTTSEAVTEVQPYTARGGTVVAIDGRLDNRDDLRRALGGSVCGADGDAAFVAAAYDRWGDDAFARLIGEFALAIWDARGRRLVCARDVIGVRPLCYSRAGDGTVLVASELRALLDTGCVDDAVNEARALEHLAERGQSRRETLFRDVYRLEPAHQLIASRSVVEQRRYWDLGGVRDIRYRDARDYAAHARDVLTIAIRAHSRTHRRPAVLLSGGVDSSAVLVLARAAGVECDAVTLTAAGQDFDEAPLARVAAAACGARLYEAGYRPSRAHAYEQYAADTLELPPSPNAVMLDPVRALARAQGITVLLSGLGGDEWFSGSPFHYADWIYGLRWMHAARQAVADVRRRGVGPVASDIVRLGVWPGMPDPLRGIVTRLRRSGTPVPTWVPVAAAARTQLAARVAARLTRQRGETYAQADQRAQATAGFYVHALESEDRAASRAGVEQRHPLHDRRVIEFALGVPETQRWQGPWRKVVLRAALEGLLPDRIRLRRDKAEFSRVFLDALAGIDDALPMQRTPQMEDVPPMQEAPPMQLVARGWIDPTELAVMRRELRAWQASGDDRFWGALGPIWMCYALECWLTQLTRRNDGSRSRRATTVA